MEEEVLQLYEQGLTVVNFVVCLTNLFKSSHGMWFMLPEALIIDLYTHFMDRDDFGEFAKFAFSEYGHRVKHWITINEPYESSLGGYDTAEKAPGRCSKYVNEKCVGGDSGHEVYTLSHNLLLAHTEAVEEFRKCAKCKDGNIGIVRSPMWFEPYEKKSSSEEIVKRALDFTLGWHLESVTQGDYPLTMKDSVVTSAFVAHVDNVNQEKPSCEFSLQITFTKSRWVQDWFSAGYFQISSVS
ncbi:BnaC09g31060D [Brassica napus]|uniref:thioglucosidase n=1 Tax=Brassica napus TaxID=3708 RepID=A0A078IC86_BRANA|nr:BnaC09g31060D [Brassica napus]